MRRFTIARLARYRWELDGKPDGHGLGEANKGTYEREAEDVVNAIRTLGFKIVDSSCFVVRRIGADKSRPKG